MTRDELESTARAYLAALDALDLDAVMERFAPDAELTVQTGHVTVRGEAAIRELWQGILAAHERMEHRVTAVVADPAARKVATEQAFVGERRDGTREERYSAYVFDVDADLRFTRAIVWIDGETPAAE